MWAGGFATIVCSFLKWVTCYASSDRGIPEISLILTVASWQI